MKRLTHDEVRVERLLRAARSVAVLGASGTRGRGGSAVVEYLKNEGFEIFPVHPERAEVAGLGSWARLEDIPGPIDILLVLRSQPPAPATIAAAAGKGARILWLARGVPASDAETEAVRHGLLVVRNRDIAVEQRHTEEVAGQPRKRAQSRGRRGREAKPGEAAGHARGGQTGLRRKRG
jgi:predicted CoA-binding protein